MKPKPKKVHYFMDDVEYRDADEFWAMWEAAEAIHSGLVDPCEICGKYDLRGISWSWLGGKPVGAP